jgi:uncharacterized circularly permuted ATP-grasp superfamily protein/uncharacterized alpha-E superfamily protein
MSWTDAKDSRESEATIADLTAGYSPVAGIFDEMMDPAGGIRPQWRGLLDGLGAMPEAELRSHWETARRLVRENGTTYNVYDDTGESAHRWRMDPIPFLIPAEEWRRLEAGLIQRARLLNAVIADLYGPQKLLTEGKLPPSLVFGNPSFLRALHGIELKAGGWLNFIAVDLARAADNKWWVLSDRTQAPSGAGYALENRVVMGQTLPAIFRSQQVQRLAGFFQALSDNLVRLSGSDDPLIVLLTPGPHNETYFEHAYLARYLGFPLVEGEDLTVRDNKVFLKTLNGLRQVHLIFRRVDSEYCDPLELRTDSLLGVAGLVAAARAGNCVVANALGSGLVECDALMSFMPGLCREMLGEALQLPSTATWWCGQERERDFVLDNLDRLVIRPTFSNRTILADRMNAIQPAHLTPAERETLIERIRLRGYDYIGQEVLPLSTTPSWRDGTLQPRPLVLRVYLCADGDGYRVMPGGLARIADDTSAHAVSMQQGDASKDTWVLWDAPVSTFSRLAAPDQIVALRRSGNNLPSRVADNLFWLGRYAERTENSLRLMRAMILRLVGEAGAGDDPHTLQRLIAILVDLGYLRQRAGRRAVAAGIRGVEREVAGLIFDRQSTTGLLSLLDNLQRTAALVRDRLSGDAWRLLNNLHGVARSRAQGSGLDVDGALALLNTIIEELAAFSGMQMENMTRSVGWRLLDIGRRIERATHLATLVRELATEGEAAVEGRLDLLLELGDSTMTYRTRYLSAVQLPPVLDLLVVDETNPRSIAFQAAVLKDHISVLPRDSEMASLSREEYLVEALASELKLLDIDWICRSRTKRGKLLHLDRLLARQQNRCMEITDTLARTYFSHATAKRSGVAIGGGAMGGGIE